MSGNVLEEHASPKEDSYLDVYFELEPSVYEQLNWPHKFIIGNNGQRAICYHKECNVLVFEHPIDAWNHIVLFHPKEYR